MQFHWNSRQNCWWIKQVVEGYERSRGDLKMVKTIKLARTSGLMSPSSLSLTPKLLN